MRAWQLAAAAKSWQAAGRKAARASRPDESGIGDALPSNPAGFSHPQRLHSPKEFGRVFAEPARSSDRFFTVLGRANERSVARLGLTISRRTAKRAVDRNRLKRLARETFRMQQLPSWDFVVLARAGADRAERRVLRESLERHFERLRGVAVASRNG
jgi:ribonuclease P protein component